MSKLIMRLDKMQRLISLQTHFGANEEFPNFCIFSLYLWSYLLLENFPALDAGH